MRVKVFNSKQAATKDYAKVSVSKLNNIPGNTGPPVVSFSRMTRLSERRTSQSRIGSEITGINTLNSEVLLDQTRLIIQESQSKLEIETVRYI